MTLKRGKATHLFAEHLLRADPSLLPFHAFPCLVLERNVIVFVKLQKARAS